MKKHLLGILGLSLCSIAFTSTVTATTTTVFEDFSGALSLNKFFRTERNFSLDTENDRLNVEMKGKAFTRSGKSFSMEFNDSSINKIKADITLTTASLGNVETQQVLLRLAGRFYNSQSDAATSSLGEVFADIAIGDRGNGLEAWYEIVTSTNDDFTEQDLIQGSLGTVTVNTPYPASISYDGDHTFTFIFNNGTAVNIDGPARAGAAYNSFKAIGTRLRFGHNSSTPNDSNDELPDDGTVATIAGTFDNVTADDVLVDDFSASDIDTNIWQNDQRSAQITDEGKLKLVAIGQGSTKTAKLFLREQNFKSFGATVTFLDGTTNNNDARPRARVQHIMGNDTFDIENGETPDGYTGNIWTQFTLERRQGVLRAIVYAERAKNADWSDSDDLFFEVVSTDINENQEYDLLIDVTGTIVEYKLDGELMHSFDMTSDHSDVLSGNVYPYSKGGSGIIARIQDAAGETHVLFDDIRTSIAALSIVLNAQNSEDKNVVLSTSSDNFVNEEEIVTLSASSIEATNSVFLWEQTTGDSVEVITTALRDNLALRDVLGNGSTFSFKVPVGSNEEDLGFSVSVVNTDNGSEATETFVLKVDNTETSTLAGADVSDTTSSSSSGGGSFNPYLFALMLMAYAGTFVRRMNS